MIALPVGESKRSYMIDSNQQILRQVLQAQQVVREQLRRLSRSRLTTR
jgi:hypothetical protein